MGPQAARSTGLAPARPTPFTSSTTLEFALPTQDNVDLSVFGVDGRRVRTLATGPREPGEYQFVWNNSDDQGHRMPPGLYYARLTTRGQRLTRTLVRLGR